MNAKPFFVLLVFVLFLAVFASGSIGDTDLTPDTPPAPSSGSTGGVDYGIFGGSSVQPSGNSGLPITSSPENSPCGASYTVRSGDTLSRIARSCAVTLRDLLAANPSIQNPNLILVGQKITIYHPVTAAKPAATPKTRPTAVAANKTKAAKASSGLKPGDSVTVFVVGFPPKTKVQVGIGEVGAKPQSAGEQQTGANGSLSVSIKIPPEAKSGQKWVVTVSSQKMKVTGAPFEIGK